MKHLSSIYEILNDYEGILFDAFGVLVNEQGPLEGAIPLLQHLQEAKIPYWMLSNGSSKTVAATTKRYVDMGLPFDESQVISSGGLLAAHLETCTKPGQKVAVLGTTGSKQLVSDAGRVPINATDHDDYQVAVIANQTDFPFIEHVDALLSHIIRRLDKGQDFHLVLTNPDLFYPRSLDSFGITAGSVSLIIEESLKLRYGQLPEGLLTKLGKPFQPMFDEAKKRSGSQNLLMVGDQIYTDVKGANEAGIHSLLLGTGLTQVDHLKGLDESLMPHYYAEGLDHA